MKRVNAIRGAALPETALVLTAMLAMLFGIVQICVIGFLQILCDGAAFVAAHEYSLGNSAYLQYARAPFPTFGAAYEDLNGPDASSTSVPVAYPTGASAREGGASLILPSHAQATVHATAPGGALGVGVAGFSKVDLHGTTIEPEYQLNNDVYDAAAKGYTGASAQTNFFTDQENTPYYYVSNHRLITCATKSMTTTSGTTTPTISSFNSTNCPVANQVLRSLGTAEYLTQENWYHSYLGVQLTGPGTFWEVLCHERMYSYAAKYVFVHAASASAMPDVDITNIDWPTSVTSPSAAGVVGQIYIQDRTYPINFAANSYTYHQDDLQPYSYCSDYLQ